MERKSPIHVPLLRWTTKTTKTLVLALANVVLALITHPRKHVGDLKLRLFPILYFLIWMVNRSIDKGQKLWWQSQDGSEDLLWVNWTSIINVLVWYGYIEKEWLPLWLSHCNFRYSESLWTLLVYLLWRGWLFCKILITSKFLAFPACFFFEFECNIKVEYLLHTSGCI